MNLKRVKDSSFGRLMDILSNQTFAIITAYRHTDADGNVLTKKQNIQRNRDLLGKLNAEKMGGYSLVGHWQEAPEGLSYEQAKSQHKLIDVTERSYVVPKRKDLSDDDFIKFITECLTVDGLTQDACIVHTDKYYLLTPDGSLTEIGTKVELGKLGQAYSQSVLALDVPFVFDSIEHPQSVAGYMYFDRAGLLYLR